MVSPSGVSRTRLARDSNVVIIRRNVQRCRQTTPSTCRRSPAHKSMHFRPHRPMDGRPSLLGTSSDPPLHGNGKRPFVRTVWCIRQLHTLERSPVACSRISRKDTAAADRIDQVLDVAVTICRGTCGAIWRRELLFCNLNATGR